MNRFKKQTHRGSFLKPLLPAAVFLFFLFLLFGGLSSVTSVTAEKERESLKNAVIQSAVQCYALEGFYPENLDYLKKHYGIRYDDDKYVVSYEAAGENLMPSVTVIPLKDKEGR